MPRNSIKKLIFARLQSIYEKDISFYIASFLAIIVASSFILASWLMRPVGDDYIWLSTFYNNPNWVSDTWNYISTANGRYSQNILATVPYSILGPKFIKLAGILAVGLFVFTGFTAIQVLSKKNSLGINKSKAFFISLIIFLSYTIISTTLPATRGGVDNTIQSILNYPSAITYVVPYMLMFLMVLYLIRIDKSKWGATDGALAFIAGLFLGMFGELSTLVFFVITTIIASFYAIFYKKRFVAFTRGFWKGFLVLASGLLAGVLVVRFSPGSSARSQAVVDLAGGTQLSLAKALNDSFVGANYYISTYAVGPTMGSYVPFICVVVLGATLSLYIFKNNPKLIPKLSFAVLHAALFLLLFTALVAVCSFTYQYGYLRSSPFDNIVPRFEIFFNIWLSLALLLMGALITKFLLSLSTHSQKILHLYSALLVAAGLYIAVPILNQASDRLRSVAVYSNSWDRQDIILKKHATMHADITAHTKVQGIGDAYYVNCDAKKKEKRWLSRDIGKYYGISKVCAK